MSLAVRSSPSVTIRTFSLNRQRRRYAAPSTSAFIDLIT